MANITITIDDSEYEKITTSFSDVYPIPTDPETGAALYGADTGLKKQLKQFILKTVYQSNQIRSLKSIQDDNDELSSSITI